ncbi:MAG: YcxB family protein, partial [Oscillospiraceae bacterium]
MNTIAVFKTPFTESVNSKFQLFHLIRRKIGFFVFLVFMCISCIALVVFQALTMGDKFNQSSAIVTIALMIVLVGMYFLGLSKGKKIFLAHKAKYGELVNVCTFFDDVFTQENAVGKLQLEYCKVSKIYETKEYFYLYFSNTSACVIGKDK